MGTQNFDLERHRGLLYAFAMQLCRDPVLAEDLVQETMLKAWHSRGRYEDRGNFTGWLLTILRKTFYKFYFKKKQRKEEVEWESLAEEMSVEPEQYRSAVMRDALRSLACLPEHQRDILLSYMCFDCTLEEISRRRGISIGTVKSGLSRAQSNLRRALEPYNIILDPGKPTYHSERTRKLLSMIGMQWKR